MDKNDEDPRDCYASSYRNFLAARMFAIVSGMNAENQQRRVQGESMAYTDKSYFDIVKEHDDAFEKFQNKLTLWK